MTSHLALVPSGAPPVPAPVAETWEQEQARLRVRALDLLTTERSHEPGTGFLDLDRLTGPFVPGNLVIVLARPSMGKTTFAMGVASRPAWRERGFVYFPTEEEGAAAQLRYAATLAGCHPGSAVAGLLHADDQRRVARAMGQLDGRHVFRDLARPTTAAVGAACYEAAERGLSLVIVDHAHRMALAETESQRVSLENVIRQFKDFAVQAQVTILLLAQARRAEGEVGMVSCPRVSEGLGTSAIEQEGDTVLGLFKPLARPLDRGQRADYDAKVRPISDALLPHTMGVEVLKFRRNGDRVGDRALLTCRDGQLTDRAGAA